MPEPDENVWTAPTSGIYQFGVANTMPDALTEAELVATLIGRTITAATWWEPDGRDTFECGEHVILTLDDGRVIRFGGYGLHTDGGATISAEGR